MSFYEETNIREKGQEFLNCCLKCENKHGI